MAAREATAVGAAMVVAGMAMIGFTDNLVRLIAADAGLWQFHLMRSLMALPLLVLGAAALGLPLRPRRLGPVLARSALQTASMLLYFGALPMLPIAQVAAALFTAPLWVLLFSAAIWRRRIGAPTLGAVALGFAGALAMLRPDVGDLALAAAMPLAAGALYALSNIVTREYCAEEPVAALVGFFFAGLGIAGAVALGLLALLPPPEAWRAAAPFLTQGWSAPGPALTGWIFVQAAGSLVAVGLIARGYQIGETSRIAVFEYSFLLTASFWAWVLWGEGLAPLDVIGIAMIVVSGAAVARISARGRPAAAGG